MVTYKEFEIIKYLMQFQGNTNGAFLAFLDQHLHYPVFSSPKEVLTLMATLQRKGYLDDFTVTEFARKELEPCRVKSAFILAAGGSDISAKSVYSMPKGLYKKNGETLIERQIRQLQEAGIEDIHVVVGIKKEMYFFLEEKCGVTLEINPYPKKNNIYSIFAIADLLDNSYICNCDNYFASNPFFPYEYNAFHATVHMDDASQELLVRKNESGRITQVYNGGKGIGGECVYGHAYFDRGFSSRMRRYVKEEIDDFRIDSLFWEEFVARHIENLDIYARPYRTDFLYEFDSIQEIQNIDGLFMENVSGKITEKICDVLHCQEKDVHNIEILSKGLTNVLFTFVVRGVKYIFRYPGESSGNIVYRKKECRAQLLAAESGVDTTYVYIDEDGCKISRFVENCKPLGDIYYKDLEFMKELARKIRQFHDAGRNMTDWKDYFNDPIVEADRLMVDASHMKGDLLRRFREDHARIVRLFQYAERDGVEKTMCHNDINGDNCLLTDDSFDVIDWEFAGFNDPAYDFGRVIADYEFDDPDIDAILEAYFGRPATELERLHWIAYVGIHNWYYFGWALYKESINEDTRDWMLFFYKKAKKVLDYALPRYEKYYAVR